MKLIYCANGNARLASIARAAGFALGAQLPGTVYFPIDFADQDWRNPRRAAYMDALAQHRPRMATVLDYEHAAQRAEVLDWAEEAAQYVQDVIIVPKVCGTIAALPRRVGGRRVVLGYSVPTRYAGTGVPVWEFAGWPVHLLGGSPRRQREIYQYLRCIAQVVSTDGNYAQKMAVRYCQYFSATPVPGARVRYWPELQEVDGEKWTQDAPYEAWRRSCVNIFKMWSEI